jgi:hypothetical protein
MMSIEDFGSLDAGPGAVEMPDDVFVNFNNPAIENPFQVASRSLVGDPDDVQVSASTLLEFKNLYTPAELNSIVDAFVSETGDAETGSLLKNLLGSDTTLSDTASAAANKIPVGEGDITTAGYTTKDLNKIGSDATKTTDKKGILGTDITASDAAKYAAMLAIAKMAYDDAQRAREAAKGWSPKSSPTVTAHRSGKTNGVTYRRAATGGGIGSLDMARGGRALPPRYLDGHSDGMADKVSANIDGKRPAALSDGEFVIPADVVSHLGNGNSNAGAKRLYEMMDRIRAARTGNPKQGKQINPDKFMPR